MVSLFFFPNLNTLCMIIVSAGCIPFTCIYDNKFGTRFSRFDSFIMKLRYSFSSNGITYIHKHIYQILCLLSLTIYLYLSLKSVKILWIR